jgi:hypothetical protein
MARTAVVLASLLALGLGSAPLTQHYPRSAATSAVFPLVLRRA